MASSSESKYCLRHSDQDRKDTCKLYTLNLRPSEFLDACNSIVWTPWIDTGVASMAIKMSLVANHDAHKMQLYAARTSNNLSILFWLGSVLQALLFQKNGRQNIEGGLRSGGLRTLVSRWSRVGTNLSLMVYQTARFYWTIMYNSINPLS